MKLYTIDDCHSLENEEIKRLYRDHVSPSITEILDSFAFSGEIIVKAEGVWLKSKSGKRILDVTGGAGVLNLGHNPPSVLLARQKFQEEKRMEVHKSFFSPYLAALSHNLAQIMPGDLNYSFFCNSGAEAVEGALKIAYKYHEGKRDVVLHSDISFHGKLIASGNITQSTSESFRFQDVLKHDSFAYGDIESVKNLIRKHKSSIYSLIVEPFSASHLRHLSPEFLQQLREVCNQEGILLIFDEVYTGWFKTGPLLSFMNTDVVPDIVTLSKSLGGGKSSLSAYVVRDHVMKKSYSRVKEALLHTTTYNGFAEECVTAIESINLLMDPVIANSAARIEVQVKLRMERLKEKYPQLIEDMRGRGAIHGFYLARKGMPELILKVLPTNIIMGDGFIDKLLLAGIINRMFEKHQIHSLFMTSGKPSLLFSPSLIITDEEIDIYFDALEDVLQEGVWNLALQFVKTKMGKYFS